MGRPKKKPAPISVGQSKNGMIRSSYDTSKTTVNDMNHWKNADGLSAVQSTNKQVRHTLVNRARYEVENSCYAKGLVNSISEAIVGSGVRLHVISGNEKLDATLSKNFAKDCKKIKLPEKMRVAINGEITDGEAFPLFFFNPKLKGDSQLDVRIIETERVSSLSDTNKRFIDNSPNYVDGIKYDDYGNIEYFNVLKGHPSEFSSMGEVGSERIMPEQMKQMFRQDRIGQRRGVPQITQALPLLAQLRRYTLAVLDTAETASNFAGVIKTDAPADGEAVAVTPMETVEVQKRMLLTLPEGWDISQLKAEQPTSTYGDFKKEILDEACRCILVPSNVMRGDSSNYNYASGRLDGQWFVRAIEIRRETIEQCWLNDFVELWLDEQEITTPNLRRLRKEMDIELYWDGEFHVDPTKEAQAQAQRLLNKTTTLKIECAKEGLDYRAIIKQAGIEKKLLESVGLVIGEVPPPVAENKDKPQPKGAKNANTKK